MIAFQSSVGDFEINVSQVDIIPWGSYRGIFVMRDQLILFSVKPEFNKLFLVIRDLYVLRDSWRT